MYDFFTITSHQAHPAFSEDDAIPVAFTLDNKYILLFLVALYSLFKNSAENTQFDIFIIHRLSQKNIKRILQLCEKFPGRSRINFVELDDSKLKDILNISGARKYNTNYAHYYRLFLSEIIRNHDKVVYSDVDVLFLTDLKKMYEIDLEDNFIAAVQFNHTQKSTNILADDNYYYFTKDKDFNGKYFATGNIVLNLKKMREDRTIKKYQPIIDKYKNDFIYTDQDILNYLFYDKVKYIDLKWCVNCNLIYGNNARYLEEGGHLENYPPSAVRDAINTPYILHYTGRKPDKKLYSKSNSLWLRYLYQGYGIKGIIDYSLNLVSSVALSVIRKMNRLLAQ